MKSAQRALELHAATAASTGRPPTLGAEELLPLVAYVLVRSRTAILPAELAFVADFLPEGMANGQASLTHQISPHTPYFPSCHTAIFPFVSAMFMLNFTSRKGTR